MGKMALQPTSYDVWEMKYQLKDQDSNPIDKTVDDTNLRVANALAVSENDPQYWAKKFKWAIDNGATPAGRIMSNAGAGEHKPSTSTVNCTVSSTVEDSIKGILKGVYEAGLTLAAGCGIGYEFSTLRPRGAQISGAGAQTSGSLSFMNIYDSMCFTIASSGGRRGACMATFAAWHPDVEEFIVAKREDGRFRQFNLSLLIDDSFISAVVGEEDWDLYFPVKEGQSLTGSEVLKPVPWDVAYCKKQKYIFGPDETKFLCKVYKTVKAVDLWNKIIDSNYNFAEPGFLLIDQINKMNNNYFCEKIRACNPCKLFTARLH